MSLLNTKRYKDSKELPFVRCMLCGETFKWIHTNHLKFKHKITQTEYSNLYPHQPIIIQEVIRKKIKYQKTRFNKGLVDKRFNPDEAKKGKDINCYKKSKAFKDRISKAHIGKYVSIKIRNRISNSHKGLLSGKNHPSYIDGRSLIIKYCSKCGKKLSDYRAKQCQHCDRIEKIRKLCGTGWKNYVKKCKAIKRIENNEDGREGKHL